jgi:hypothetical protein
VGLKASGHRFERPTCACLAKVMEDSLDSEREMRTITLQTTATTQVGVYSKLCPSFPPAIFNSQSAVSNSFLDQYHDGPHIREKKKVGDRMESITGDRSKLRRVVEMESYTIY